MEIQQAELVKTYKSMLSTLEYKINICISDDETAHRTIVNEEIGLIDERIQNGECLNTILTGFEEIIITQPMTSILFASLIHHYLDKGNIVGLDAWKLLFQANSYVDFESGYAFYLYSPNNQKQQNREQVQSSARVKLKIIELLYEKRLTNSWDSVSDVIDDIIEEVSNFIATDPDNVLAKHTVRDNIRRWSKKETLVKIAFDKALRQDNFS